MLILHVELDRLVAGMGLIGAGAALASVVAALIAWEIGGSDGITAFTLLAMLSAIALTGMFFLVSEPERRNEPLTKADIQLPLARVWPFFAITLLGFCVSAILKQVMTLYLQDTFHFTMDESVAKAGAAMTGTAIGMIVMQGVVLRLLSLRPEILLGAGTVLAKFPMIICSLATTYQEVVATLILFGIALSCMLPGNLASISLRVGRSAQAKAAGMNVIGHGLGLAAGPLAGAGLYQVSARAPFIAAAGLLVLCAALALFSLTRKAASPASPG